MPAGDVRSGDADLLFVGAPTHFFGVPRARTRRLWVNGQQKASWERGQPTAALEPTAADAGVREWLDALPTGRGKRAAAFDTRLDRPLAGAAAPRIARALRRCTADPRQWRSRTASLLLMWLAPDPVERRLPAAQTMRTHQSFRALRPGASPSEAARLAK